VVEVGPLPAPLLRSLGEQLHGLRAARTAFRAAGDAPFGFLQPLFRLA
jgi:hypothetical protein